jgi:hypothetical protein
LLDSIATHEAPLIAPDGGWMQKNPDDCGRGRAAVPGERFELPTNGLQICRARLKIFPNFTNRGPFGVKVRAVAGQRCDVFCLARRSQGCGGIRWTRDDSWIAPLVGRLRFALAENTASKYKPAHIAGAAHIAICGCMSLCGAINKWTAPCHRSAACRAGG